MARKLFDICWQIVFLWLVFRCGVWLVGALNLSLPGNVAGMLIMFALLASGIVKPGLIEAGSGFLLKHFAFFFIPISVGLISFGGLMRQSGLELLVILIVSALVGAAVTGTAVQQLQQRRDR
ncbi:CidA/LrgA family protein [Geomonas anaerohicana]|uniref:CidA/LrgA family protein n=1 Tax=Geomonas anaerohicana TaxID=2798583 RepID=A0ABS0YIF6_9BACT|nr:CidA/LrgA family protein [Geomonas anaerohicana]MBJ6752109.1 CidA/LrgA family protein [Geomonas anaerohicana]